MIVRSLVLLIAMSGCGAPSHGTTLESPATEVVEEGDVVGVTTKSEILREDRWPEAYDAATPDSEISSSLASVPTGATVDVYLGTWCGDSVREVARLFAALDQAGQVPFEVRYIAVDRSKSEPAGLLAGQDIGYVPTFVVRRDGEEVGRIIESAPNGIEADLHSLLSGSASGVISGRDDV